MPEVIGHAPFLLALLMGNNNNNELAKQQNGSPVAGTVVVHEHIAEADYLCAPQSLEAGTIRLRAESPNVQGLTAAQCEVYNRNGYLVLPDALTAAEAAGLLEEVRHVMKRISEGGKGITRHDVSGSGVKGLSPVGRVLATFEPADITASTPFERRIARLGCGIHQNMPSFRALTHSELHRSIAESLGYSNPRITQSQLIAKLAGIGGRIVPHQDGCVNFTNPPSGLTFWYALEDATSENGCLCVAGGSHLTTPLRQRLTKADDGQPRFEDLKESLWAKGVHDRGIEGEKMEHEYQPLEVKKGTLILFHGNLMHTSGTNRSEKSRIAYTFSIIDGDAECPDDSYVKPLEGSFPSL